MKFRLIGQRSLKWFNSQMLHVFPGYLEFLAIFNLHVFSSFNLFSLKGMFFFSGHIESLLSMFHLP